MVVRQRRKHSFCSILISFEYIRKTTQSENHVKDNEQGRIKHSVEPACIKENKQAPSEYSVEPAHTRQNTLRHRKLYILVSALDAGYLVCYR